MAVLNRRSPYRNWRMDQAWGQNFTINRASPQATGLVTWWPTQGNSGKNVLHDFSRSNNAPFPGGAANPTWITSANGWLLQYDGSDFIETGVTRVGNTGLFCTATEQFTAVIWYRRAAGQGRTILARAGGAAASRTFHLYDNFGGFFTVLRGGAADAWAINPVAGTLQCIAVTWDGATAIGYVDGIAESAGLTVGAAAEESAQEIVLGDRTSNGVADFALTAGGALGETRIYNRALSPTEIYAQFAPSTRWDLYKPTKRAFFMGPTAVIRVPRYGFTNFQIPGIV